MMMRHIATLTVAASALLTVAITAAEARKIEDPQGGMNNERNQRGGQWKHVSGTIQKTKQVEVRGQNHENFVVQLKNNRGGKTIVDLGNAKYIQDLDLQKGDFLTAWGRSVNIGDKQVFMAHKVQANDETIEIERRQVSPRDMRQGGRNTDRYEFGGSRQDQSQQSSRQPGDNG